MKTLILATSLPSVTVLITWLVYAAIACLVIWGIMELVKWSGIPIPRPVWIILTVLIGVILIVWIAKAFGLMI